MTRQGYELNVLPRISEGVLETFSAASVDKENVILDTIAVLSSQPVSQI